MKCPRCGKEVETPDKEWDCHHFKAKLFHCHSCGGVFRAYYRGDQLAYTVPRTRRTHKGQHTEEDSDVHY